MSEGVTLKPLVLNPPLKTTLIRDAAGLELLKDFFNRCDKNIGFDIETTPLKDYFWRRCRTIQFGNQTEQYVIDLLAFCDGDSDLLYKAQGYYGLNIPQQLQPVVEAIKPVLCSKDFLKIGVNLSFEYQNFYWLFGLRTWNFFDCSLVEKCIWAGVHSMKDYGFYSMEEMMARYFEVQIEKALQESFTLEGELTSDQVKYAALDTRYPFALRKIQLLILQGCTAKTHPALKKIDPILLGDNLMETAQLENDAIGAFQDMHVHGERLDREPWLKRIAEKKLELKALILEKLDPIFLPIVGNKNQIITEEEIATAEATWKAYNTVPQAETDLLREWRLAKKDPALLAAFETDHTVIVVVPKKGSKDVTHERILKLTADRKAEKEKLKHLHSELRKKRTAIKNLAAECAGNALINYSSNAQLLHVLVGMKGLKHLSNLDDETLEKYEHIPVIKAIRDLHGLDKEIGTYGDQWATEWKTKPCKEEGWLHPGDGRLHCVFNQYDAETGRSTSEKPNGQNLPHDDKQGWPRSCFIADPPGRVSNCCEAEAVYNSGPQPDLDMSYICRGCRKFLHPDETKPEEYVIVTADMSGAELRIIAELADDPVWIEAFARGEDVHSVGTEILYPEKWPALALPGCGYFKPHTAETVAKNPLRVLGQPQREKCKCPEHKDLRDANKSTNFLLAYGGGPQTLSVRIKKTLDEARELMALHEAKFPRIWAYLEKSGKDSQMFKRSFDMFGRRRLFPEPTWERAKEKAKEDREEKLQFPKEEQERNLANFVAFHNRKPTKEELWMLKHRLPTNKEVANAYKAMHGSIQRQGKNHAIQGTNASIAKKAMGCGFSPDGKPYLWHTLPQYRAKLIKFVHDELVIQCPKQFGKEVAALVGDAFKRAAAEKMKKVVMEFDYNVATYWKK